MPSSVKIFVGGLEFIEFRRLNYALPMLQKFQRSRCSLLELQEALGEVP